MALDWWYGFVGALWIVGKSGLGGILWRVGFSALGSNMLLFFIYLGFVPTNYNI